MKAQRLALISAVLIVSFMFVAPLFTLVSATTTVPSVAFSNPRVPVGQSSSSSLNWAGYVVTGSSVTDVKGSFVVPSFTCSSSGTYVALWAGIDGYTSSTVEQAGVLAECTSTGAAPVYSTWYEFYPSAPVYVTSSVPVSGGDNVYVEVSYSNGAFIATITSYSGTTELGTYTTSPITVTGALETSAEWIVERPALCSAVICTLSTLANFGTASYGLQYTSQSNTNYATVSGTTGSIGSFSSVVALTMVSGGHHSQTLASPSSLTDSGTSFTVSQPSTSSGGGGHHGKP